MSIGRYLLAALLLGSSLAPSQAQDSYPARTVKVIIPSASGSTTDMLARLVAEQLGQKWGKPVIVENVSGAGMVIGATQAVRSPPDGYTLFICPPSPVTFMHPSLPQPHFRAGAIRSDRAACPGAQRAGRAEGLSRRQPEGADCLRQGQSGQDDVRLAGRRLDRPPVGDPARALGDLNMVHVPYRGAVPALNDVVAGHVDMFFDTVTTSVPMYRAAKARIFRRKHGAFDRRAGGPDHGGSRAGGLSLGHLVRHGRTARVCADAGGQDQDRDVVDSLKRPEVSDLQRLTLEPMIGSPADAARFFAEEAALWDESSGKGT